MTSWSVWLVLAAVVCLQSPQVSAQKVFIGRCPTQSVVQDFDISRYLGKWYEIEKYFAFFELGGRCITATYSEKSEGIISVLNEQTNLLTNRAKNIEGEAELVDPSSGEGKLYVSFFSDIFPGLTDMQENGNYWVLDTDYDSYTLVWSCKELGLIHTQNLWILTREQYPDPVLVQQIKNDIIDRKLDASWLDVTDQSNCS